MSCYEIREKIEIALQNKCDNIVSGIVNNRLEFTHVSQSFANLFPAASIDDVVGKNIYKITSSDNHKKIKTVVSKFSENNTTILIFLNTVFQNASHLICWITYARFIDKELYEIHAIGFILSNCPFSWLYKLKDIDTCTLGKLWNQLRLYLDKKNDILSLVKNEM